jgi:hypothetical protein
MFVTHLKTFIFRVRASGKSATICRRSSKKSLRRLPLWTSRRFMAPWLDHFFIIYFWGTATSTFFSYQHLKSAKRQHHYYFISFDEKFKTIKLLLSSELQHELARHFFTLYFIETYGKRDYVEPNHCHHLS